MVSASRVPDHLPPADRVTVRIQRLHEVLLETLAPMRILAAINMTRKAYRTVETRIVTVFKAEQQ